MSDYRWPNLRACKESNIRAAFPDLLDQELMVHRPLARPKQSCYKSGRRAFQETYRELPHRFSR